MANSHHPFDRPQGGKGDRDIRTNPAQYRAGLLWERSTCCNAHIKPEPNNQFTCRACGKPTTLVSDQTNRTKTK